MTQKSHTSPSPPTAWRLLVFLIAAWGLVLLSSCGSQLTTTELFTVEMYGVFQAPVNATGTSVPRWETFLLKGVSLQYDGEATPRQLYTDEEKTIRVLDRPQIIFSQELTSDEDGTISAATVQFDPTVVAAGRVSEDYELTLDQGDLVLSESREVSSKQSFTLYIRVKWRNTIIEDPETGEESASAPSFDLSYR